MTWELRSRIHALLEKDLEDGVEDIRAEFLQSQLEAVSCVCPTVRELRAEVQRMREEAASVAHALGLTVAVAGTHPFSPWTEQQVTRGDRYRVLAEELQEVGRRLLTFGLHVHVGIADPDLRVQVMSRIRPYLPVLLALSTSSPFFDGRNTGLCSYRLALLAALPRTGIPPRFDSWDDYEATIKALVTAGLLPGPRFIWWDVRLNPRFPTLEIRIADMPGRVAETVCLAAWVQALALKLAREPAAPPMHRFIVETSRWQAARYGLQARLLLSLDEPICGVSEWVERLLVWLADVADELGSGPELAYARTILAQGTSADRQLRVWQETGDLGAVVAHLVQEMWE